MPAELSVLTRYPCPVEGCGQYFKMKADWDRHKITAHGGPSVVQSSQHGLQKSSARIEVPEEVECTYSTCNRVFKTKSEMLRHKEDDPQHDYCRKCDVDCDDFEHFVKHKVESPEHICCPVCGLEFKSQGGMKRHVNLAHQRDHKLVCVGCAQIFPKAGGLIDHLDAGKCRNVRNPRQAITQDRFQDCVKHKIVVDYVLSHKNPQEALTGPATNSGKDSVNAASKTTSAPGQSLTGKPASQGDDSDDGGALLGTAVEEQSNDYPPLAPGSAAKVSAARRTVASNNGHGESLNGSQNYGGRASINNLQSKTYAAATRTTLHSGQSALTVGTANSETMPWSSLQSHPPSTPNNGAWDNSVSSPKPGDTEATPALTASSFAAALQARNDDYERKYPNAAKNKNTASVPASLNAAANADKTAETANIFSPHFLQPDSPHFSAEIFFNSLLGRYCCPYPGCDFTTQEPSQLSAHMKSDMHAASRTLRCPGCYGVFKSLTALISHFESPSLKCTIRKSDNYGRIMDKFSGGFISVQRAAPPRQHKAELDPVSETAEEVSWEADRMKFAEHLRGNEPRYEAAKPEGFW